MPSIVGGFDIHRKQITFDYLDTATAEVSCGQIAPADRAHLRAWLARFEDPRYDTKLWMRDLMVGAAYLPK
jgi:hypothetical protein